MKTVTLPCGERVPAFGLGTWNIGDDAATRAEEIATLRLGLDSGAALIDTAEMYGDGRSEELIAEAIAGRRDEVFLVSKVYPQNASAKGAVAACERSLRRLNTDRIDLYLALARQCPAGRDAAGIHAPRRPAKSAITASAISISGTCGTVAVAGRWRRENQLLYNLTRRGIGGICPGCAGVRCRYGVFAHRAGAACGNRKLAGFAERRDMTPAQAALAWLLARDDVMVIPKTGAASG